MAEDDFAVTAVYVAFRNARADAFVDQAINLLTGGDQVHCELVFLITSNKSSQSTLATVGAIDPHGVYRSAVQTDAFFGLCDNNGSYLPVDVKHGGTIGWQWLDITMLFNQHLRQRNRALLWLLRRVGTAGYRRDTYFTFLLPCGREGVVDIDDSVSVKDQYICSELVADVVLGFATLSSAQRKQLQASSQRFFAVESLTQKISPASLYTTLSSFENVQELSSAQVRLLVRSV